MYCYLTINKMNNLKNDKPQKKQKQIFCSLLWIRPQNQTVRRIRIPQCWRLKRESPATRSPLWIWLRRTRPTSLFNYHWRNWTTWTSTSEYYWPLSKIYHSNPGRTIRTRINWHWNPLRTWTQTQNGTTDPWKWNERSKIEFHKDLQWRPKQIPKIFAHRRNLHGN